MEKAYPMKTLQLSFGLVAALSLTACGGGGGGGGNNNQNPIPDYVDLNESGISADSTLAGRGTSGGTVRTITGTLNHQERALSLFVDGNPVLTVTEDGAGGGWSDGTTSIQPSVRQTGSYEYVALFTVSSLSSPVDGDVVFGVVTDIGDMPVSGSATYSGEAFITGATLAGAGSLAGSSTVNVTFGGDVDVTLTGFGSSDFDEIRLTDMTLSGTSFSGGTLAILQGSDDVTDALLGTGVSGAAAGDFFGLDEASGQPDEVGGVLDYRGANDEILTGGFLGNRN